MNLANKTIWITGASSGIGKALAIACAKKGARIILSSRNTEALEQVKSSLTSSQQHLIVPLDLAQPEQLNELVVNAMSQIGHVDVLVNNGGIGQRGFACETQLDVQRKVMEVNYFGAIAMTQALLPFMKQQGQGTIATVASVAGLVGGKSMAGYSASKHAIVGYMDCLRAEETTNGIKVLNICPGFVHTQISVNAFRGDGSKFDEMASSIANGIAVEDCADQIVTALEKDKAQVIIGKGISYWAPTVNKFFPAIFRRLAAAKNYRE
ncbi:SDR family oxidoreductase [Pseudoalteromonas piscicida]|uniref:SDR family oxidoreductase n=1 Tax=Pseudoalteromonas piscicida TaxID=43662 RepID=A0AAD0RLN3_PSEO7|nr:SDR family oxidoreductase [Pseudoalteromonas piscicida]ASD69502.1 short chain dehydrogenase [Pseudoalteromonas piscicida]AXR00112.1 SDR family oxidoreductase [Pseudoalteromonas piscicida]AXR04138.1 SDR family oxidoreductase [Pseudoalteromonas piscicida]